jgi:predicted ATPase
VEDTPELFSTMHGVVAYLTVRGRFDEAYELADELVARAALQPDATPRLIAHRAVGFASFVIGRLQDAEAHLNQALAIYDPALHLPLARVLAQDVKAAALAYLLLTQVVLNREADAVRSAEIAIDHVRDLHHPHSQVAVYAFVAGMHLIRGTPKEALPLADETIMISETQGFQLWYSGGVMLRGAARSQLGEAASGIAELRDGIARMDAVGATIWGDYARLLLAEALARDGKLQPAYDEVLRGLAASEGTLGRWYEAELHRLRGDLETRLGQPAAVAQSSYRRAMVIAERQGAGLWYQRARRAEHVLCS